MKAGKILAGVLVAIGVVAFLSVIIVKEVNQAIILQFGDPKRIIMKPGLNFKIPFIQNVVYLDKRILNLDAPPEEVIASDQKRLIVDAFARFQIVDPLKFYISVGNERVARSRLSTIINSRNYSDNFRRLRKWSSNYTSSNSKSGSTRSSNWCI